VERHLVQILVVVANSQLETLAAEVEKGSLMSLKKPIDKLAFY